MTTKTEELQKIRDEVFELKNSPLCEYRVKSGNYPVLGEGSHDAKIMFIGEAPGRNEAKTGRPFCGAAGEILDDLLASVGIPRKEVYITNIVKDRPQNNRDPLPNEIEIYGPFLDRQIEIIKPNIIATLGRYSMDYIMKKFDLSEQLESISQIHGKCFSAKIGERDVKIILLYHPAAAIYNQSLKSILLEDFKILRNFKK